MRAPHILRAAVACILLMVSGVWSLPGQEADAGLAEPDAPSPVDAPASSETGPGRLAEPDPPAEPVPGAPGSGAADAGRALPVPGELLDLFERGEDSVAGPRRGAGDGTTAPSGEPDPPTPTAAEPLAPEEPADAAPADDVASIARELEVDRRWPQIARATGGVVADRQVIAYYGHPRSRFMGILGENAIEIMSEQLKARAAEYDAINGEIGVAPAYHIIYGTVNPDASVGIINQQKLIEYIEFAAENDIIVFLDHQIGGGTVEDSVRVMLPYLRYPHVHLAFDPEWATDRPGQVIGGVHADEINLAQQMIQDYLIENDLPGPRMLVVHQFNWRMIAERERVRTDFPLVQLIHHADGFGSPPDKRASWQFNVIAGNMPLKGFKLFYPKSWRDGGYDIPLMTPQEVMQLEPVPVYIQYQ